MTSLNERLDKIRDNLGSARTTLNTVLDQVDGRWDAQVYSDGAAWNIQQLLIHLSTAERDMVRLVQNIAKGEGGVPEDFDLERYNKRSVEKRAEMTPDEARENLVNVTRPALLEWLDTIDDEAILEREGRHGTMTVMSVEQILMIIGDHERLHAEDIAKALNISL